jgi:DNA (cytosine-5)-methyltransferase 1
MGLRDAGFDVIVGVDHDPTALETYASLFPGLALDRDLADQPAVDEIIELLAECKVSLIAGGPPCQPFSRAGNAKIRSLVSAGMRSPHDRRRDLWESFLDIVLAVQPPMVLLENVPEMAIGGDMEILRTLVTQLEHAGYDVHTRILKAAEHGIPQFRQRMFLVAVENGRTFTWPKPDETGVSVGAAIGDLPAVEGGWRPAGGAAGFLPYRRRPEANSFVRRARSGLTGSAAGRLYDHITRPVREDDRRIFEQMDSRTLYSDLAEELKRYRDDIFDDKYKRLDLREPSRSITAHIARDGYWYIHPAQLRTLTVREAARLQTFPDRVRFAGPPSAAFRQIGNAVPPLLAEKVGRGLLKRSGHVVAASTTELSSKLAAWFIDREHLSIPWLDASTAWQVIQAELLLNRVGAVAAREAWTSIEKLETPHDSIASVGVLRETARLVGRAGRVPRVLAAARWFIRAHDTEPASVDSIAANPHVTRPIASLAMLVTGTTPLGPILQPAPVLRVAARYTGEPVDQVDRGSAGRIAVARLIGGSLYQGTADDSRFAQAALLELATAVCRPKRTRCEDCPLSNGCAFRRSLGAATVGQLPKVVAVRKTK